jgi:acyl-coenzyme A thioesterase PaaI-like protein
MALVEIPARFCGPPSSANGGWTAGLLAAALPGAVEVTLRVPPPLDRSLERRLEDDGTATLRDGDTLVAQARTVDAVDAEPRGPVDLATARAAEAHYAWAEQHPYPTCFVCGIARTDGLGIFAGAVPGRDDGLLAATWTPEPDAVGDDGLVRPGWVWAALDCPSGLAVVAAGAVGLILLGRLTAEVLAPVPAGGPLVVTAWGLGSEGRKLHAASALWSADGRLLARARAVWIAVAPGA